MDALLKQLEQGLAVIKQASQLSYQYNERVIVFERAKVKLYHYVAKTKNTHQPPLLIVFATVNRPEILDLFPTHSFISGLLAKGEDVYLLDWGYPDHADQHISMSNYITDYLYHCVTYIIKHSRQEKINLLGICQGGLISLCYALIFKNIKNLVLISVPIDFYTPDNIVAHMLRRIDINQLLAFTGNAPGHFITQFFISLRPFALIGKKYFDFIKQLDNKEKVKKFLQVEKWLYDSPDQAGAAFRELVAELYCNNKLIKSEWRINGKTMDLTKLDIPVLNIMAKQDEIVPMSASRVLKRYIHPSLYSERIFDSGHIGIYISDKVGARLPQAISRWLKRQE